MWGREGPEVVEGALLLFPVRGEGQRGHLDGAGGLHGGAYNAL